MIESVIGSVYNYAEYMYKYTVFVLRGKWLLYSCYAFSSRGCNSCIIMHCVVVKGALDSGSRIVACMRF